MTEKEMLANVRMMDEMFPAFIEHYKLAAVQGNVDVWAKAVHSVIDLVAHDGQLMCPHGLMRKECGLCDDERRASLAAGQSHQTEEK